jgi:thiamine kinase-like enzyme
MSDHLSPDAVLSQIPGWEGASWTVLEQCVTNRPYLVEKDGRKAVLKIDAEVRAEPFNNRHEEARIQRVAREAGLAGDVLYVTDTILMTEYLEGVVWSLDCLDDNANIAQLALALRKLHSLPLTGRTFDVVGAARMYARINGGANTGIAKQCVARIEAAPRPLNLCRCHNDLVVANIINTPETKFLDWEYACDNDPFFDLATIAAHHKLTQEQCDTLLNAYFDGNGERWREQLARQSEVYEALLWLWEAAWSQRDMQGDQGGDGG